MGVMMKYFAGIVVFVALITGCGQRDRTVQSITTTTSGVSKLPVLDLHCPKGDKTSQMIADYQMDVVGGAQTPSEAVDDLLNSDGLSAVLSKMDRKVVASNSTEELVGFYDQTNAQFETTLEWRGHSWVAVSYSACESVVNAK